MRYFFIVVFSMIGFTTLSQDLSVARKYFYNYEYDRAASIFQEEYNTNGLEEEDLKHLVYSYYVTGDFNSCQPLSDELLEKSKKIEPMFYLISGDANRGVGNYSKAIKSYEDYLANEGEEDVKIKIASCREIINWDNEEHVSFDELSTNGKMADISGGMYEGNIIHIKETGYDNMQEQMGVVQDENSSYAELLLTQPSILVDGEYKNIFMKDSSMASVTSISFVPESKTALLTISYPLSKDPLERAPNLYWGTLTSDNYFDNVIPFEYSGINDNSSTAHATISSSGNHIIYTKAGQNTNGADLFMTTLENGEWSKPKSLSSINSDGDEMFPVFLGDSMLTFSSSGRIGYGGLDIYKVNFPFNDLQVGHFKAPINSLQDDFNLTYVNEDSAIFVSNRINGTGDDDLYYITFRRKVEEVDTFNVDDFIANWKTKNVYFEFDKFTLSKSLSDKNITELNTFFEKCDDCKIELHGFTDSRGSSGYNLKLSKKRAEEVKSMLVDAGFETDKIRVIPKGESDQPFDCGENCSLEQHKLNRVVQINLKKD